MLLEVEEASEYGCVASGGHAAVGVASKVAGNALRQQPVASIPQGQTNILHLLRPRVAAACIVSSPTAAAGKMSAVVEVYRQRVNARPA